ncbi:MAG: crosslink repair DNA glycosylase YcaQ family protein, partial [Acidimicrobiales bacterium]
MIPDRLTRRQLNRATLARQLLLHRSARSTIEAVHHLVGLQAQVPTNPYLALWSRLDGFAPEGLGQLLLDRRVVRIVVMRATLHLVTADDCLVLRPLMQPVLDAELARHREFGPPLVGLDLD